MTNCRSMLGVNANRRCRFQLGTENRIQAAIASVMIKQGVVHKGTRLFAHVTHDCNDSKTAVSPDQLSAIPPRLSPIVEAWLF